MKNPQDSATELELLRTAIIDQRISVDEAIQVIIDAAAWRVSSPAHEFGRAVVRQRSIEARLAAVEAWQLTTDARREIPKLLRSFLQNWRVVAVVALITSIETVCLTFLLKT